MALIVSETMNAGETSHGRILEELRNRDPELYARAVEDRFIFLVALKLYDIGSIPVAGFYQSRKRVILRPSEEFNVEYCLVKIREAMEGLDTIKELTVNKMENEINVLIEKSESEIKVVETIQMTDMLFKVVK